MHAEQAAAEQGSSLRASDFWEKVVYALLALAVLRFWIMPLGASFWIDETGTFWCIKDGFRQLLARSDEWPSTPIAYGLICQAAYALGGAHEWVMRLPSVIGMGIAALLTHRLVKHLVDVESALPAVAVLVCSGSIAFAAVDARPYAVMLALIIGSTLALVQWLDGGGLADAIVYVVAVSLIPQFHVLAASLLGVHAIYAVVRMREGSPVRWWHVIAAGASVVILVAPVVPRVLRLGRTAREHIWIARRPLLTDVAEILVPHVLLFGAGLGLFGAWLLYRNLRLVRPAGRPSALWLLATLTLGPILLFFAASLVSPVGIFVERYMIASVAGLAMLIGVGIGRIRPLRARALVTASVIICSIGSYGNMGRLWPLHHREDWRGAMAAVRSIAGTSQMPVLVQSGFIESATMNLDYTRSLPGYLMAPLTMYPAAGHLFPLSLSLNDRTRDYLQASVVPAIELENRFLLVTIGDDPYHLWFAGRLPSWSGRSQGNFGVVNVSLFERRTVR